VTDEPRVLSTQHGYFVASRSVPGAFRLVSQDGCTCPATRRCWHQRAVAFREAADREANRLPPAPVNVSAMVD
jgi:hypothetical protein